MKVGCERCATLRRSPRGLKALPAAVVAADIHAAVPPDNRPERRISTAKPWRLVALLAASLLAPASALAQADTARDEFNAIGYSGDDGTISWAGPWQEVGESDGPTTGRVRVELVPECVAGNCLRIGGAGVSNNGRGLFRQADFTGFGQATLTYRYRRTVDFDGAGDVTVSVSSDGISWTDLTSYSLTASGPAQVFESFDISPWISLTTQIRFLRSVAGSLLRLDSSSLSGRFRFDESVRQRSGS